MFHNIGGKIKVLAQTICWLGIIASLVLGGILIFRGLEMGAEDGAAGIVIQGFLIIVIGSFFSWIGSFMTYGFGQLIENSDILVENSEILVEKQEQLLDNSVRIIENTNQLSKH